NNKILGARIKKARLAKGLTQAKLAEGICTQAQISNIEKGTNNDNPSSHTLFLLSEKLDTSMSYLYGQDNAFHGNVQDVEFDELRGIINRIKSRRDYETLNYIIKHELENFNNTDEFFNQYLQWHKALVVYYVEHNFEKAESLILNALNINVGEESLRTTTQKIRVKMSYSNFLMNQERHDEAKALLDECMSDYDELIQNNSMSFELLELHNYLILNLSNIYFNQQKYEEILELISKAIEQSHKYNSMVSLGDFYYQIALANKRLNHLELYFMNVEKALTIFDLQRNDQMYMFVSKKLELTNKELELLTVSK
ncbi:MAG TPA: helix-turn-helix transcriptional regulator, partial [Aliicoccus persicus]|nr:helix-turn-helix transcriptional regulator [Aliicoccus persicus]